MSKYSDSGGNAEMAQATPTPSPLRLLAVALGYFVTGWLGLQIAIVGSNITLIWLPTGIAVAALFRWGWRYWPAVWLAALAVNLSIGSPALLAAAISIGNTLAPLCAVALLRRWNFNAQVARLQDIQVFVGGGALLGMTVSASWGVASLLAGGLLPWSAAPWAWTAWWLGDAVGVIVAGLALVTFDRQQLRHLLLGKGRRDFSIALGLVALVGLGWTKSQMHPLGDTAMVTLAIPVVVWIAMRLGPWAAATAVLILSSCAALALLAGDHLLQGESLHQAILVLWSRMVLLAALSMLVAALTAERRRMEVLLRVSEQALQSISQGVVISGPDRNIRSTNAAFSQITGYSAAAILGRDCKFLQGPLTDPACIAAISLALTRREEFAGEVLNYRKNGETFWNELTLSPITNARGELTQFVGIVRDITARKQTEQRLTRLVAEQKALLENDLVGIVTVKDRKILWANPAFGRMLGYDPAELVGTPTRNNYPSDAAYQVFGAQAYPVISAGVPFRAQLLQVRKDGSRIWLDANGALLDVETGESLWGFTDISGLVSAVAELRRSNAELEQFSYSVSHDLRQPLRMVSSYLQLLQKGLGDTLDVEQRQYFNFAIDGAKRMDAMMLGLLDYSRVGRKGEPPAWIDTRAVLDEALLFLHPLVAEVQAEVHIEGVWPRVLARPDELTRLLQNLVGNALKFRVAGRTPQIHIASVATDREWQLCVSDNGVGIAPDQIGRLFQVFARLQSRAAYDGNGIGLALCRKIAEHHGGTIRAESAGEGQGSRFCISLPLAQAESIA